MSINLAAAHILSPLHPFYTTNRGQLAQVNVKEFKRTLKTSKTKIHISLLATGLHAEITL